MDYMLISDFLWYSGHILSACSVLFSHTNYNLSILFVFFGQFITIISRPISRIKNTSKITPAIPAISEINKDNLIEYII